jgi:hypothetical protein
MTSVSASANAAVNAAPAGDVQDASWLALLQTADACAAVADTSQCGNEGLDAGANATNG